MKITKTIREVWTSKKFKDDEGIGSTDATKETFTTYDVEIVPDELPELVNNCIRAGLGDIKPILQEAIKNFKS